MVIADHDFQKIVDSAAAAGLVVFVENGSFVDFVANVEIGLADINCRVSWIDNDHCCWEWIGRV